MDGRVVFDIEADGFLYQATRIWCVALQNADTGEKEFYEPDSIGEAIASLRDAECLIGHNIIGYDLPCIWKLHGTWDSVPLIVDTLTISRALYPERYGGHGLEDWGVRLGYPKIEFDQWDQYSKEMGVYCQNDVALNDLILKEEENEYGTTFTGYKVY